MTHQDARAASELPLWDELRRRARAHLVRHSLSLASRPARRWLTALVLSAGVAALLLGSAALGAPLRGIDPWLDLAVGLTCLLAVTIAQTGALWHWYSDPARERPPRPWLLRVLAGSLGLGGIAIVILAFLPIQVGLEGATLDALGVLMWAGLACSWFAVLRTPPAGRSARGSVLLAVWLPAAGVIGAVLTTAAAWGPGAATTLLFFPVGLVAVAAITTVPPILIRGGIEAVLTARDRGVRAARILRARPARVVVLLLAKIGLLLGLALVVPLWSPGTQLISGHPVSWLAAVLVAVLVLLLLWFDAPRRPSHEHDRLLPRLAAWLVFVPLGGVVAVVAGRSALPGLLAAPFALWGVGLVALVGYLLARRPSRLAGWLGWTASATVGVLAWALFGRLRVQAIPVVEALPAPTGLAVVGSGFGAALIGVVGWALWRRRGRVLLYLAAVGFWVALNVALAGVTPGIRALDIDLVLTLLLALGVLTFRMGWVRRIDPSEAVTTAIVVLLVVDVPVLLIAVPPGVATWLVAGGIVVGILLESWTVLPSLSSPRRRAASLFSLSLSSLACAMTTALVWSLGPLDGSVLDALNSALLTVVALPVAVLLVSRSSPGMGGTGAP